MIHTRNIAQISPLATCVALTLMASGPMSSTTLVAAENKEPVAVSEPPQIVQTMTLKEQIAFSRLDLATRLGVEMEAVSVSGSTPVKWRSVALGCPEPGKTYDPMLVPGVMIMLRVGKDIYRYDSLPGREPFYCPADRAEPAYVSPEDA